MKSRIVPFVAVTMFLAGSSPSLAAERPLNGLPEWMLGQWVVTKVYEDPYVPRPDPEAEPIVWLSDQIMTVEPDRIELGSRACVDFHIGKKTGLLGDFVKTYTGATLEQMNIEDENTTLPLTIINCGKILDIDKTMNTTSDGWTISWEIIMSNKDQLRMFFYGGSFLKLRRLAPTS